MSDALKDYLGFCQQRVEQALELRLPSEKYTAAKTAYRNALLCVRWR